MIYIFGTSRCTSTREMLIVPWVIPTPFFATLDSDSFLSKNMSLLRATGTTPFFDKCLSVCCSGDNIIQHNAVLLLCLLIPPYVKVRLEGVNIYPAHNWVNLSTALALIPLTLASLQAAYIEAGALECTARVSSPGATALASWHVEFSTFWKFQTALLFIHTFVQLASRLVLSCHCVHSNAAHTNASLHLNSVERHYLMLWQTRYMPGRAQTALVIPNNTRNKICDEYQNSDRTVF